MSSMDTAPLICLHISARRLAAGVDGWSTRLDIPVECETDAGAFGKIIHLKIRSAIYTLFISGLKVLVQSYQT